LKKQLGIVSVVTLLVASLFTLTALASDAQMYFSSDKNGQSRVTSIQEGDEIFIVVVDNDENIDCDIRDKFWTDVKIMDPKTGAYIVWVSYFDAAGVDLDGNGIGETLYNSPNYVAHTGHDPGNDAGWLGADYFEETGPDTGVFVSKRSFQVGTRVDYQIEQGNTHVVDNTQRAAEPAAGFPWDFQGGHFLYSADDVVGGSQGLRGAFVAPNQAGWRHVGLWGAVGPLTPATIFAQYSAFITGALPPVAPVQDWVGNYLLGRFENMDSLWGMYVDQNDPTDVAIATGKIIDTEATVTWDQKVYKDANASATITVVDPDENLNCNQIEYVPVFIIVNPGSWNPVNKAPGPPAGNWNVAEFPSPNSFCTLKLTGGVDPAAADNADPRFEPIRWYNWYMSGLADPWLGGDINNNQPNDEGAYFIEYPVAGENNVTFFDTTDPEGLCRVSFYAQETGVNTGEFQLNLNQILQDLGFDQLNVRDVLVAYYMDPNDDDDFKLATAYIEEFAHSSTTFTDATRNEKEMFWIGRDPVYVQVVDANANVDPCCPEQVVVNICDPHHEDDWEWVILDEVSSNSPVFFTNAGLQLWPVWDALGVGILGWPGGYQLQVDNWKLEVFNEDDVYARYNDVYYELDASGLAGIGDIEWNNFTATPPQIDRVRVANDVSFAMMHIGDSQVVGFDGSVSMYFLDRNGNTVSGYVNGDCVFIKVIDRDQDEDQYRRERIDGFWDGGQNLPFGPWDLEDNHAACGFLDNIDHPFNALLGDTNMFSGAGVAVAGDNGTDVRPLSTFPKIYVLNPRSGMWAAVDLLETGVATGEFVSTICIDLVDVYECVPSLGVLPGDTLVAFYQDPTNHSDSAMISIKVGIGGGGTPPSQASTTLFVDAAGNEVANYMDSDMAYVKVIDPSHAGQALLANAVEIDGDTYDLAPLAGAADDTFITEGLDLGFAAGDTITATYTDPTDPTDTSDDTITIIASELAVSDFYATPSPFEDEVEFTFDGTGIATTMSVEVRDMASHVVWAEELANVTGIVWDGTDMNGAQLANGGYIYVIMATDGTNTFSDKGIVFINR